MAQRNIRVYAEGKAAEQVLQLSIYNKGFIGSSVIISHRPGISDIIVYSPLLDVIESQKAVVIFPLDQPAKVPQFCDLIPVKLSEGFSTNNFKPGKAYRLVHETEDDSSETVFQYLSELLLHWKRKSPLIFVVDTIQKWSTSLETAIRFFVREAPLTNMGVWLHCTISLVPVDLLTTIGNVVAIWPSVNELELLQRHLPSDQIVMGDKSHPRGILFFSNKLVDGKGWQYSRLQKD